MLTKTQLEVLKLFSSRIGERLSIKQVSELLRKPYPLVHRSVHGLLDNGFLEKDQHGYLSLDYRAHHGELCYAECLRRDAFLAENRALGLFARDAIGRMPDDFFIILLFGSAVRKGVRARDVDVLVVAEEGRSLEKVEKAMDNIAGDFSLALDISVIPADGLAEMVSRRDEANVANESLANHIILFGAESYYRVISRARR